VLPTLRFSRKFGLVFLWSCRFFLRTYGLLVFGLVLIEICLFFADFCFADCFFSNFMAILLFESTAKSILGVFLRRFAHFGLVFRICHPDSLFDFPANFSFCWIFLPTHFGLVFCLNYLFLACFSNFLACSWKITWHHCFAVKVVVLECCEKTACLVPEITDIVNSGQTQRKYKSGAAKRVEQAKRDEQIKKKMPCLLTRVWDKLDL